MVIKRVAKLRSAGLKVAQMEDEKRLSIIKNIGNYVYWKFEGLWVGHFEKYPEYLSQGETISELREGLLKIHDLIKQGKLKSP